MNKSKLLSAALLSSSFFATQLEAGMWPFGKKTDVEKELEQAKKERDLYKNRNIELRKDLRISRAQSQNAVENNQTSFTSEIRKDARRANEDTNFEGVSLSEVIENGLGQVIESTDKAVQKITAQNEVLSDEIREIANRLTLVEEKQELIKLKAPHRAKDIQLLIERGENAKPAIYAFRANGKMKYEFNLVALDSLFSNHTFNSIRISAIDFRNEKIQGSPFTPANFSPFMMDKGRDERINANIWIHALVSEFYVEAHGIDESDRPVKLSGFLPVKFDDELNWMICEKIGDDYAFKKGGDHISAMFYHRSLLLDPSNATVCGKLASALNQIGEFEKSILFFQRARKMDSNNPEIKKNYAIALGNKKTKIENELILDDPVSSFEEEPNHHYHRTNSDRVLEDRHTKRVRRDQRVHDEVSFYEGYAK